MKKIALMILILLTACGQEPNEASKNSQQSDKPVKGKLEAVKEIGKTVKDTVTTTADQAVKQVDKVVEGLKSAPEDIKSMAEGEVEKLFALEYKVFELETLATSAADLEKKLIELGKERWDCFHTQQHQTKTFFLCKRYPKTYLRYLPRMF